MALIILLPALIFFLLLARSLYQLYRHPLSSIPGPKLAACTSLWLAYHTYTGDECSTLFALHQKYGPVLRIGPNDIDIASGDAIESIYLVRGGFPKTPVYSKFDIEAHSTIFSTLTLPERASRAKAVAPLFSTASIRNSRETLLSVVDDFIERLRQGAQSDRPVNVLGLARAMAIDAVSAYLFQERYGALNESAEIMSASPFVDAYPAGMAKSFTAIDDYTSRLVKQAGPKSGSYQSRLLERVSPGQTQIEIKDVCFAGTDSTGMSTATIIWYLAKYPEIYTNLRLALQNNPPDVDPVSTPYLRAVVREGLRLSWANPIRLPRSVPAGGWKYKSYFFPAGTSVGVSAWQLHQEENVFPEPLSFKPERWLEPNVTDDMLHNFFAFGKGTRACIAQNLGTAEVTLAIWKVVEGDVLRGARILEWFNSRVKGEEILVQWIDKP
ncbi:cytochrome P450 [Aspergillus recurvatus]